MVKKKITKRKNSSRTSKTIKAKPLQRNTSTPYRPSVGIAVLGLIVNLFFPGIGSIIGGRTKAGIWQLVLFIVGIILTLTEIGIVVIIASWVWALITSILILQNDTK